MRSRANTLANNDPFTDACLHNLRDDVIKLKHFPRYWPFVWVDIPNDWWISLTKASDAWLWYFFWSRPEQTVQQTIETPVIWDAIALIMKSL